MQQHPILILDTSDDVAKLKIELMSTESLQFVVNGESASHIFSVRMLTEHLLRELSSGAHSFGISYSEDEISAITMASTLHDIGKLQIPESILNFPGSLSPLEYDIIKKHAVLGEESIRAAVADQIDPQIVEYAAQIARNHHERIDGMGYPSGLRGRDIPLYAQVVSLADSYDALIGVRSYKKAISQDVALQMIENGRCGAFDKELVACLGRVVQHQNIIAFRELLEKKRRVVECEEEQQANRVLLVGNTEYLDRDFTSQTFPKSKVTIIGSNGAVISDQAKLFRPRKFSMRTILETYDFDLIVFFSEGLSFRSSEKSDSAELRELLKYSTTLQKNARILYLSPLDAEFESNIDRAIIASANEKMCEFYASKHSLDIKIIRIPYLYSGTHEKDFLHNIFEQLYNHQTVEISEAASSQMHFLSMDDLSELIIRNVGGWKSGNGILSVGDEFHLTFSDLAKKILELDEHALIDFTDSDCTGALRTSKTDLRYQHGWYAKISLVDDLRDQYERFLATKQQKNFRERVKGWISEHSAVVCTIELFLLFFLTEFFVHQTGSAVIFSVVDFRTVFIVIMSVLYGSIFGVAAATLSSISYIFARISAGTNPLTLFYEPTNWLTFAVFFLVAGICGYVHRKHRDDSKELEETNALLQDKLHLTTELYEDTLQDKRELKKQINSSKDSFGKILDITRKLNAIAPQLLYLKIIETFEEVLENKSIAVYSITPNMPFGRLEVSSRDLSDTVARSIDLAKFAPVIEKIKDGGVWKNTKLNLDYPMYATGIHRNGELILMICLWHADVEQRTIYYTNLFRILCDLASISIMRAYDYHLALFEKKYIPHTHIMNPPYFEECIRNYSALLEKKVSSFLLLSIDCHGHTLEEVDEMIAAKIRTTDILGILPNGQLLLLLPQATLNDLPFILPRYEGLDITVMLYDPNRIPATTARKPAPVSRKVLRVAKGILPSAIVELADTVAGVVSGAVSGPVSVELSDIFSSKKK